MNTPISYIPSQILSGDAEHLRQHSFTRWMSPDLLQAATDFCKNLGLSAIYSECSPDQLTRYLFWRVPQGAGIEVRSGRSEDQFRKYDEANLTKGWQLLTLHINESEIYSAVWISPAHYEAAITTLAFYGITPARRAFAD